MEFNVSNYEDVLEYLPDNSKQVIKNNPYDITKNIIVYFLFFKSKY